MGWRTWTGILLWAACLSPILGVFLWHVYEFNVRPWRIPSAEIDRLVQAMLAKDDPEYAAFIEEQAAWFRSDTFEQGKWRRVRRKLRRLGPA